MASGRRASPTSSVTPATTATSNAFWMEICCKLSFSLSIPLISPILKERMWLCVSSQTETNPLFRQTKIHNIGATFVGIDKFENKYHEKLHDTQYARKLDIGKFSGRHRWVEYAEKGRYNASQLPPEWHGWLHHITDSTGDKLLMEKPKPYRVEHKENFFGGGEELIYHSKGHALNPGQRDWTRYQPWEPKKEEAS